MTNPTEAARAVAEHDKVLDVTSMGFLALGHSVEQTGPVRGCLRAYGAWLIFLIGHLGLATPARVDADEYLTETWTTDEGLPNNSVTALLQTADGYLWIGTSNGLARFDGARFVNYRKGELGGLPSNRVRCLVEAGEGRLFVGTEGGGVARLVNGRFEVFGTADGLSSATILTLGLDSNGRLWAGTVAGLNCLENGRFSSFFRIDGLPDDLVSSVALSSDGRLVFATPKGLVEHRAAGARLFTRLNRSQVGAVELVQAGIGDALWFTTSNALWRTALDSPAPPVCVYSGEVTALCSTRNPALWFGTDRGELWRIDSQRTTSIAAFDRGIVALLEDREGNVWAGTENGLRRVKRRQVHVLNPPEDLADQPVVSLLAAGITNLWMAYENGALRTWAGGSYGLPFAANLPQSAYFRSVGGAASSNVWFGTLGEGLFRATEFEVEHWSQRDGLSDSAVEIVLADGLGGAWVGTRNGGLNYVRQGRIRRFHTPWGFTGNYARAMALDRSGTLWVGTAGDGLFSVATNQIASSHGTWDGLPDNDIRAVLVDPDNRVWVGTAGGLATRIGERWHSFTTRSGLPENSVYQIQDDGMGNLWIAANQLLYRVSKLALLEKAGGMRLQVEIVPYGRSDGLAEIQYLPGAQVRSSSAERSRLWFPATKGVVMVDPDEMRINRLPPPVVIEQVLIDNESFTPASAIRDGPGRDTVQFQYTALSLSAPEKVRFRCRLEGFDPEWVDMGASRSARYSKLPPGRYVFQVTACNNDGIWNETGAQLAVMLQPFWWQTAWFKVAGGGAACAIIGFLLQTRRARTRELEKLRVRIAADLHDEIGSSLWSITLLSKMMQNYGTMGEEERRDIGEIHRIAKQTSNSVRDIVWLINPGLDTTQDLVLRMRDFLGATLRSTTFQIRSEQADLSRRLPLEFRQNCFLIFKEAITNVARHAKASRVEVSLAEKDGTMEMRIQDDGIGFPPTQPTPGNGLPSLHRRAEMIRGKLVVRSASGAGTVVSLTAPL